MKQRSRDLLKMLMNTYERIARKLELQKGEPNSFKKSKFSVLWLAGFENLMYFCTVFHGIRFKVSEDWLSGDNQFS